MHSSTDVIEGQAYKISYIYVMAALAALCKPHSASEQKLNTPIHSTLLDDFVMVLLYLSFHYKIYFEKVPGFGISKPKRYNLRGFGSSS